METIGRQTLSSFFDERQAITKAKNTTIRKGVGHPVDSYFKLAMKVAELQFLNREHVLLFRGQSRDHKNKQGNTSLKPNLFRVAGGGNPDDALLVKRFEKLRVAEAELVRRYIKQRMLGSDRLKRHRLLRWSIIQHYDICPTPLLDVTHSLRIAASFASKQDRDEAYLFVVGIPNLSGAITVSSEAGLQVVRLSSACPPSAVRPHLQEGYLLGEYPEMPDFDQKTHYKHYEIDFGRRLVAKFRFNPQTFWRSSNYPPIPDLALYPKEQRDSFSSIASDIKAMLGD